MKMGFGRGTQDLEKQAGAFCASRQADMGDGLSQGVRPRRYTQKTHSLWGLYRDHIIVYAGFSVEMYSTNLVCFFRP